MNLMKSGLEQLVSSEMTFRHDEMFMRRRLLIYRGLDHKERGMIKYIISLSI